MGRAGPLTALALGRSPYDITVPGEGEDNPREPHQQYDSRGRPVNPETRRINRDIVRAHNEVMMVIGVAELEHSAAASSATATAERNRSHREHYERDHLVGTWLLNLDRAVEMVGVWGIVGLRQRILLYRRYTRISLWDIILRENKERPKLNFAFVGLPIAVLNETAKWLINRIFPYNPRSRWNWLSGSAGMYLHIHVLLYATLQRLDLVSASQWLPPWAFFVPFTAASPISPVGFPSAWTRPALAAWSLDTVTRIGPFAAFFAMRVVWARMQRYLFHRIIRIVPSTAMRPKDLRLEPVEKYETESSGGMLQWLLESSWSWMVESSRGWLRERRDVRVSLAPQSAIFAPADETATVPVSLTLTGEDARQTGFTPGPSLLPRDVSDLPFEDSTVDQDEPETRHQTDSQPRAEADIQLDSHHQPTSPPPTTHRPSTASSNPSTDDDTASESEDVDVASAPIIAFDVEATEATEPVDANATSAAMWSAELRTVPGPPLQDAVSRGVPSPTYFDTMLTRLPAVFASQVFAVMVSTLLVTPVEAVTLRLVARAWRVRAGLGVADMLPVLAWPSGMGWSTTLMGVAFARLVVNMEIWSMLTGMSAVLHLSEDEWKEVWKAREEKRRRGVEGAGAGETLGGNVE